MFATLHHLNAADLETILSEVRRVSTRLIIEKDVYKIPLDTEDFKKIIGYDELLQMFVLLSEEDQLKILMLHDYLDNAFYKGFLK